MHNRALHDALASFVEEAAWQLAAEVTGGAEVPFELIETGAGGPDSAAPLYCYRPQTGGFITERRSELMKLPSYPSARQGLELLGGLDDYLRLRGIRKVPTDDRERGDAALQAFLVAVWTESTDFEFDKARFEAAFRELERTVYADVRLTQVLAPVEGLVIDSERIELGAGLALVRAGTLREAPEELRLDGWGTVAAIRLEEGKDSAPVLEQAGARLRRLQTALRLWDDGEPAVGPGAWARSGAGPWLHVPLAVGVRRTALADTLLEPEEEDQLRAFCALVDRRVPRGGELAWALKRFELGCERPTAVDALTDWLLAGRALLGDPAQVTHEGLPQRLSAICAHAADRPELEARLQRTIALERASIAGLVRPEPEVEELIGTLGGCLRAVLRDVLCGHLDPDLRKLADELIEAAKPSEAEPAAG